MDNSPKAPNQKLDLAIIGAGPAALTAAIYATRDQLRVTVYERKAFGGLLNDISQLDNFPGFSGPGPEFATKLKQQAAAAGANLAYGDCTEVRPEADSSFSLTIDGALVYSRTVLIATGSEPRSLDFSLSKPVAYCALCEAPLYQGKNILVIGGGNSAVGESIHLADFAKSLTLVSRTGLTAESALVAKLKTCPNVTIYQQVNLPDAPVFQQALAAADGVFVFIGHRPATAFLPADLLDSQGYLIASEHMTKLPGLFAAGDVRQGSLRQAVSAAGDGAAAAVAISAFLKV